MIADVSGLTPKKLEFDSTSDGRMDLMMVLDIVSKKYKNPKQYFEYQRKNNTGWYPFIPFDMSKEEICYFESLNRIKLFIR